METIICMMLPTAEPGGLFTSVRLTRKAANFWSKAARALPINKDGLCIFAAAPLSHNSSMKSGSKLWAPRLLSLREFILFRHHKTVQFWRIGQVLFQTRHN